MFDFEWTGRNAADEADTKRGIAAALTYCAENSINPEQVYAGTCADEPEQSDLDAWSAVEMTALSAMCKDWREIPENVSLVWR